MDTPALGASVIFRQAAHEAPVNGQRDHPAVATRAWSATMLNLLVFFDATGAAPRTSVRHVGAGDATDAGWYIP